jgi:hypothetical protein
MSGIEAESFGDVHDYRLIHRKTSIKTNQTRKNDNDSISEYLDILEKIILELSFFHRFFILNFHLLLFSKAVLMKSICSTSSLDIRYMILNTITNPKSITESLRSIILSFKLLFPATVFKIQKNTAQITIA